MDTNARWVGDVSSTAAINIGALALDGGSEIAESSCGTGTYTFGSVASSGNATTGLNATTTQLNVTGAAVGDLCLVSFSQATATGKYGFGCYFDAATTSTVQLVNFDSAAIQFATGTLRVCYFGY